MWGSVLGVIQGVRLQRATRDALARAVAQDGSTGLFYRLDWEPAPLVPTAASSLVPPRDFVAPLRALADAPLPVLAQVAKTSPEDLRARLQKAGVSVQGDADTVRSLVGDDTRKQMRVLSQVVGS